MAQNEVSIVVTSKNKVKGGFDAAKKDAEDSGNAIEQIWSKHADNISKKLSGIAPLSVGLSPALIPLAGGIATAVGAVGISFGGASIVSAAFGKMASSVLTSAGQDSTKLAALQSKLADATTAKQKQAVEKQIAELETGWSKSYTQLVTITGKIQTQWQTTSRQIASPVLVPWLDAVSKGMRYLRPLVQPVADLFKSWGEDLDHYFSSRKGSDELNRIATALGKFGADQMSAIGVFLSDIGKGVVNLGRDLAGHNVDFGAFSTYLDQWGGAFLRWSQSGKARADVSKFLTWLHDNGGTVKTLLGDFAKILPNMFAGLSGAGSLELRAITDFFNLIAKLPSWMQTWIAEGLPLFVVASKVLPVITAASALVSKVISMLKTPSPVATGGGAAKEGEGAAEGKGGVPIIGGAGAWTAAGALAGGLFVGAAIRAVGDKLSPAGSFAGNLNKQFQADGQLWSTGLLHSFTFGGLEGWLTAKIGLPVGGALNNILSGAKVWGGNVEHTVTGTFSNIAGGAKTWWGNITSTVSGAWHKITGSSSSGSKAVSDAWGAAGRAADALRSRNLVPLLGQFGKVSGGVQGLAGMVTGRLNPAFNSGGSHADAFRNRNLGPLQGSLSKTSGGVQGLQHYINLLHGKTVSVGFHATGGGGVQVTPSSGVPGAKNYSVYFKPLARGGRIPGFGGGDQHPALLESGEAVIDKDRTRKLAPLFRRIGVPGFAGGGLVGGENAVAAGTGHDLAAATWVDMAAMLQLFRKALAATANPFSGITGVPSGGAIGAGAAAAQAFAKSILWAYGWGQNQFSPLQSLWNGESGWRWNALNPASGAYGIPQSLPADKMASAGPDWRTNAATQIRWGLGYIKATYGSPANTYSTWLGRSPHWYGAGGATSAGWSVLGEHGRELVKLPGGASVRPHGATEQMLAGAGGGASVVRLEISAAGQSDFEKFMLSAIRKWVRVKGAGDVQKAFGRA